MACHPLPSGSRIPFKPNYRAACAAADAGPWAGRGVTLWGVWRVTVWQWQYCRHTITQGRINSTPPNVTTMCHTSSSRGCHFSHLVWSWSKVQPASRRLLFTKINLLKTVDLDVQCVLKLPSLYNSVTWTPSATKSVEEGLVRRPAPAVRKMWDDADTMTVTRRWVGRWKVGTLNWQSHCVHFTSIKIDIYWESS